jgi:hypothetical protein
MRQRWRKRSRLRGCRSFESKRPTRAMMQLQTRAFRVGRALAMRSISVSRSVAASLANCACSVSQVWWSSRTRNTRRPARCCSDPARRTSMQLREAGPVTLLPLVSNWCNVRRFHGPQGAGPTRTGYTRLKGPIWPPIKQGWLGTIRYLQPHVRATIYPTRRSSSPGLWQYG